MGNTPKESWVVALCEEEVKEGVTATLDLCGIWERSEDGCRVGIVKGEVKGAYRSIGETYLMVVMDSPRPSLAPGTVMGWCRPMAKRGYYDAEIFTRIKGQKMSKPKRFTLRVEDDATLTMAPAGNKLVFQPLRLLPRGFKTLLRIQNQRATDMEGFRRVWPLTVSPPPHPYIL